MSPWNFRRKDPLISVFFVEHLGSEWNPIQLRNACSAHGKEFDLGLCHLPEGKQNILYFWPSVIDWLIFVTFRLNGIC